MKLSEFKTVIENLHEKQMITENLYRFILEDENFCEYMCERLSHCFYDEDEPATISDAFDDILKDIFPQNVYPKQKFVSVLAEVEKLVRLDNKIDDAIREADFRSVSTDFMKTNFSAGVSLIVDTLNIMFFDAYTDIEYFCWEVNFGKDFRGGCTYNDLHISFENATELFDLMAYERWRENDI